MRLPRTGYLTIFICTLMVMASRAVLADGTYQPIAPPSCVNNLGETVLFLISASGDGDVAAGMANRDADARPVIYRVNYEKATPAFQRFIDFHECAHHQVGHVDQPHPPRNSYDHLMNESIADCVAILRVREESNDTYQSVLDGLVDAMTLVGFPKISTDSRISNVMNCYENYGSSAEFIERVLNTQRAR